MVKTIDATKAEKEVYKKAVIERWNMRANDEQADC